MNKIDLLWREHFDRIHSVLVDLFGSEHQEMKIEEDKKR